MPLPRRSARGCTATHLSCGASSRGGVRTRRPYGMWLSWSRSCARRLAPLPHSLCSLQPAPPLPTPFAPLRTPPAPPAHPLPPPPTSPPLPARAARLPALDAAAARARVAPDGGRRLGGPEQAARRGDRDGRGQLTAAAAGLQGTRARLHHGYISESELAYLVKVDSLLPSVSYNDSHLGAGSVPRRLPRDG